MGKTFVINRKWIFKVNPIDHYLFSRGENSKFFFDFNNFFFKKKLFPITNIVANCIYHCKYFLHFFKKIRFLIFLKKKTSTAASFQKFISCVNGPNYFTNFTKSRTSSLQLQRFERSLIAWRAFEKIKRQHILTKLKNQIYLKKYFSFW